jgi:hypothetical protein
MDPKKDMPGDSTCTTCQFGDDFSNYWTATLYFRAQNGSYKRVHNIGNNQFETANGGLTIYYMQDAIYTSNQSSKVTAFKPVSSKIQLMFRLFDTWILTPDRGFACLLEISVPGV